MLGLYQGVFGEAPRLIGLTIITIITNITIIAIITIITIITIINIITNITNIIITITYAMPCHATQGHATGYDVRCMALRVT